MKRFRFTLEKILNYQESMLQKEKITLSALRAQQTRILEKIARYTGERESLHERICREAKRGISAGDLLAANYQIENIDIQLKVLKAELETVSRMVEKQLNVVLDLTREKTKLEKLKEKQLEEYRLYEARENELVISDFVSGEVIRAARA